MTLLETASKLIIKRTVNPQETGNVIHEQRSKETHDLFTSDNCICTLCVRVCTCFNRNLGTLITAAKLQGAVYHLVIKAWCSLWIRGYGSNIVKIKIGKNNLSPWNTWKGIYKPLK